MINTEGEDWELVNPEIVEVSEEEQTGIEGCLSLPGQVGHCDAPGVCEGPRAGPLRRLV